MTNKIFGVSLSRLASVLDVRHRFLKSSQLPQATEADATEASEYQLVYLHCDGENVTVETLRSRLKATGSLRRYDILTMFPINPHLWELLVSARDLARFSRCAEDCGFALECHGELRPGFLVRASILWYQKKTTGDGNPFLEVAAEIYGGLLERYTCREVLMDIIGAVRFFPTVVIMGFYGYQRDWLHFKERWAY